MDGSLHGMNLPAKSTPAFPPADVLVVDDLAEKILVYRTILEDLNVNLVTVRSGQDALREVLHREFAVILLDVNMPGMDGFETATMIRQRRRSARTPIIFLTAFTDEMRVEQGYAIGGVDYIPTPVVPAILRAKVQVFVELYEMRRLSASQAEERAMRTVAEETAERMAFLAEAAKELTRSLEFEPMLHTLAGVTVPFLADLSVLCHADSSGQPGRTECVWTEAVPEDMRRRRMASTFSDPQLQEAILTAMSSEQIQQLHRLSSIVPGGPEDGITWPDVEGGSALVLPLIVRQRVRGALALVRERDKPAYQPITIALAMELVSRAAIMLENALLVQDIQEADHRKDEFLGMLAHELRNPLGPIRNAVQLLHYSDQEKELIEHARDMIDRQVTHMARLVDDLLDATRIARGKILLRKERCDLARIVKQTVDDYAGIFSARQLRLEAELPARSVWVHGDPTRLAQAVGNLLHNAHKFTDPGGAVEVRLEVHGQEALLRVRDQGVGIDAKVMPFIFDVFRQAEQGLDRTRGGLGLGLSLVKGLVEMHNGKVSVDSDGVGMGAEFTIALPVMQAQRNTARKPMEGTDSIAPCYRILVVEDNQDTADSIRILLTRKGHEVRTAYSGTSGLEVARDFHPQVILCDIGLPGMDGYQFARAIRDDQQVTSAYVIALTGYGRDEDQVRAKEAGFDRHLTKPVDFSTLCKALAEAPVTA